MIPEAPVIGREWPLEWRNDMPEKRRSRRRAPPACPQCAATDVIPILYGEPTPDAWAAAQRGKIALGGCLINDDGSDPQWRCRRCGVGFRVGG